MSYNVKNPEIWLVGAGPMAIDHTKVLLHLGIRPLIIGRGAQSAKHFEAQTGCEVIQGGLDAFMKQNKPNAETHILIAVGTEALMPMLLKFKDASFARILVEKPAAISIEELLAHEAELKEIQDKVFVAYNRRFYPSVQKALELIEEDGGLQSMHFEFTEWSHKIEPLAKAPGVKENWFFANSTHVVDLAFYLAGQPQKWQAYSKKGSLNWHKNSFFSGAGITEKGVLFSYHSNWESAGRWGIELMTAKRKIILRPLEGVFIQNRGTINEESFPMAEDYAGLKAGLNGQLEHFINAEPNRLLSLRNHMEQSKLVLHKMLKGVNK